jgi:lipoprotein NlpI
MNNFAIRTFLPCLVLLTGIAPSLCQAQQLQAKENALAGCHIRAELINLGEPVYWIDLEPCNNLLDESSEIELSSHELLSALLNRAILLAELTEFTRARVDLDRASLIDPLSAYIQINLGLLNLLEKEYADAIENFSTALELEGAKAIALFNRALAYGYANELDKAAEDLQMLRAEYPQEFFAWVSADTSEVFPEIVALLPEAAPAAE